MLDGAIFRRQFLVGAGALATALSPATPSQAQAAPAASPASPAVPADEPLLTLMPTEHVLGLQVNLAYRWFCKLGIEDNGRPVPELPDAGDVNVAPLAVNDDERKIGFMFPGNDLELHAAAQLAQAKSERKRSMSVTPLQRRCTATVASSSRS